MLFEVPWDESFQHVATFFPRFSPWWEIHLYLHKTTRHFHLQSEDPWCPHLHDCMSSLTQSMCSVRSFENCLSCHRRRESVTFHQLIQPLYEATNSCHVLYQDKFWFRIGVLLPAVSFDAQKILKVIHEYHAVLLCNDALWSTLCHRWLRKRVRQTWRTQLANQRRCNILPHHTYKVVRFDELCSASILSFYFTVKNVLMAEQ